MNAAAKRPKALDLACGNGRHALWLAGQGWDVTAVDIALTAPPPVTTTPETTVRWMQADLAAHEFRVEPDAWDLIVCWLYWQPDLLSEIARGVRRGGLVALAGKTTGQFATSLDNYRAAFPGWKELAAGDLPAREGGSKVFRGNVFFIARRE